MKAKQLLAVMIATLIMAGSAAAASNLKANWVQYSFGNQRIVAEIENDSDEPVDAFSVAFYADGQLVPGAHSGAVHSLAPNSNIQLHANFPYDGEEHKLLVRVDTLNAIEETNENDNTAIETIPGNITQAGRQTEKPSQEESENLLDQLVLPLVAILAIIVIIFITLRGRRNA